MNVCNDFTFPFILVIHPLLFAPSQAKPSQAHSDPHFLPSHRHTLNQQWPHAEYPNSKNSISATANTADSPRPCAITSPVYPRHLTSLNLPSPILTCRSWSSRGMVITLVFRESMLPANRSRFVSRMSMRRGYERLWVCWAIQVGERLSGWVGWQWGVMPWVFRGFGHPCWILRKRSSRWKSWRDKSPWMGDMLLFICI